MRKTYIGIIAALCGLVISSCGGGEGANDKEVQEKGPSQTFHLALSEAPQVFDPVKAVDGFSFQVLEQIFEGLIRFDEKNLTIEPMLAESWEMNEDGTVFTFSLKKGVHFQDNACFKDGKGRELKASDVVYSFTRACSNFEGNYAATMFKDKLKGANDFFVGSSDEIEGIKAVDDYTVQFTLTAPSVNFLPSLATIGAAIVPKEAFGVNPIIPVGTGPFVLASSQEKKDKVVFVKNPNYHQKEKNGTQLPYLDSVVIHHVASSEKSLQLFEEGKLDVIVNIPPNSIKRLVESQIADFEAKPPKYILARFPEAVTSYLSLNTNVKPFDNPKIRQAVAMSIDKSKIVDVILNGEAFGPATNGIVPPAIANYDYQSTIGIEYNKEKAMSLLKQAGFNSGDELGTVKLHCRGESNSDLRVALEIQKQLRSALGLNVELISVSFAEKLKAENDGDYQMSLSAWLADYPNPESFLALTYGKFVSKEEGVSSYPNNSRYQSSAFDADYEKALATMDEGSRNELCLKAEQTMINDAPLVPLYYYEKYRLIQNSIVDYQPSVMHIQNLTRVKKVDTKEQRATTEKEK